jgi:hypothetical protein
LSGPKILTNPPIKQTATQSRELHQQKQAIPYQSTSKLISDPKKEKRKKERKIISIKNWIFREIEGS